MIPPAQKKTLKYYKKKKQKKADKIILTTAKKKHLIVYGARAVNQQLPSVLRKETKDYDLYAEKPRKVAKLIEKKLDKSYGFNAFKVNPARHKGTYKIRSTVTGEEVADVTLMPKKKIPVIKRKGIQYAHVKHKLENIKKSLSDPKSKFRHLKDKDTRNRILLAKKLKKKRKKRKNDIISQLNKLF